eukprot:gnl/MRDRNA2_/MRDRNA2_91853_c0_seq1.p1 gnl/MRDRNA2_/MRDRNA2_91853_c0~~gnl/MRDRNA2_/MRDRNA2_91853_c0_seq1.p1  ORF type:complete len:104 (-),score=23.09 gnl/MRDRNA2_/MRDRNA2_91853_c0_seq1:66-377(-)
MASLLRLVLMSLILHFQGLASSDAVPQQDQEICMLQKQATKVSALSSSSPGNGNADISPEFMVALGQDQKEHHDGSFGVKDRELEEVDRELERIEMELRMNSR